LIVCAKFESPVAQMATIGDGRLSTVVRLVIIVALAAETPSNGIDCRERRLKREKTS
jgi:hypothetical protein